MIEPLTDEVSETLENHKEWLRLVFSSSIALTEKQRNLRGDLSGWEFEHNDFSNSDLSYMNLSSTSFVNCKFIKTNLKGVWAPDSYFDHCLMILTDFSNVYGKGIHFRDSQVQHSDLSHSFWVEADFTNTEFKGVKAIGSFFQWSKVSNTKLSQDSHFEEAQRRNHNDFRGAHFSQANPSLKGHLLK
jgi:uncharacterized protein YjbI with pentapeptide repeats